MGDQMQLETNLESLSLLSFVLAFGHHVFFLVGFLVVWDFASFTFEKTSTTLG